MSIHLSLGNDLLRADVRAHVAGLAASLPNVEFNINVSGASLAAILAGAGAPTVVQAAPAIVQNAPTVVATAPVEDKREYSPEVQAQKDASVASGKIRRTKEEAAAGLAIEEAVAFRAQSAITDPVAFKASLTGTVATPVQTTTTEPVAAPAPTTTPVAEVAPEPTPAPVSDVPIVITEADVRAAAVAGVKGGAKDKVIAIAKEYGVADWKTLDATKYKEVFDKLTALIVVK